MTTIPTLRRKRQEDREFEAALAYIARHSLKKIIIIFFKCTGSEKMMLFSTWPGVARFCNCYLRNILRVKLMLQPVTITKSRT
jgi:hypothetical protein